jgi:hypothetical protein
MNSAAQDPRRKLLAVAVSSFREIALRRFTQPFSQAITMHKSMDRQMRRRWLQARCAGQVLRQLGRNAMIQFGVWLMDVVNKLRLA